MSKPDEAVDPLKLTEAQSKRIRVGAFQLDADQADGKTSSEQLKALFAADAARLEDASEKAGYDVLEKYGGIMAGKLP